MLTRYIYMSVFYGTKVLRSNPPLCYFYACKSKQVYSFAPVSLVYTFFLKNHSWMMDHIFFPRRILYCKHKYLGIWLIAIPGSVGFVQENPIPPHQHSRTFVKSKNTIVRCANERVKGRRRQDSFIDLSYNERLILQ